MARTNFEIEKPFKDRIEALEAERKQFKEALKSISSILNESDRNDKEQRAFTVAQHALYPPGQYPCTSLVGQIPKHQEDVSN